jgi:DNA-binding XRE family transcriptional regulator
MPVIHDLMTAAKTGAGIPSNYRLAKVLEVTEHTVGNWQNGRALPNEALTIRLAELAGLDPAPFLAEMAAGRAKDDEARGVWLAIADRLRKAPIGAAAALMLAMSFAGTPAPAHAGAGASTDEQDCALCQLKDRVRKRP